jgi:hypothetical protein
MVELYYGGLFNDGSLLRDGARRLSGGLVNAGALVQA